MQNTTSNTKKVKVLIIESERGWGQKVEETKFFDTLEEAETFIKKYNKSNVEDYNKTGSVPDWYMYAKLASK